MATTNQEEDIGPDFEKFVFRLQKEITDAVSELDGTKFREDNWKREGNNGIGRSCVIQKGNVFEKAGVNVSVVRGKLSPAAAAAMRGKGREVHIEGNSTFYACGLSLVIHPYNPMAPTAHLNYRFFQVNNEESGKSSWWVGGGADLTPSYLFEEDAKQFHSVLKGACDKHDPEYYGKFKKWCDEYFYIKHREETRGVGGIFFDDLNTRPSLAKEGVSDKRALLNFCTDCLETFASTYCEIVARRKDLPYTPEQKEWQQVRRGRYVEFNLIYDRGTQFGLHTPDNARIESVLMSMPLTARWEYMHTVEDDSEEGKLLKILKSPKEWCE